MFLSLIKIFCKRIISLLKIFVNIFLQDILKLYKVISMNRIRSLREDNNKSQKEIAALLGIQQNSYSQIENRN